MAQSPSPEDRPDPADRMPAVRARVPEHVALGQLSTGVIVVTGATEYVLDFVRNLPRPNIIVARVVLPHAVMPQFAEALATNISLYRQRYGDIPTGSAVTTISNSSGPHSKPENQAAAASGSTPESSSHLPPPAGLSPVLGAAETSTASQAAEHSSQSAGHPAEPARSNSADAASGSSSTSPSSSTPPTRHSSPQEVYDDLKLKDELLSGTYANAVMIGHGPHEFCFDFITNFYPQSAVSCRVFMAAGHVGRLLDSLRASWDQLRPRLGGQ